MHGEDTLYTYAVRDLAYGERFAKTSSATSDANPFVDLNALFLTFANHEVDTYGIPRTEVRDFAKLFVVKFFEDVHGTTPKH